MFITSYDAVFPSKEVKLINYTLYLIPILIDIALNKATREYTKNSKSIDNYTKTLLSYGKLHLGIFLLSSIVKSKYSEKGIIECENKIYKELETNLNYHFTNALTNFKKIIQNHSGNRKESIPSAVKKTELDQRIAKYIKQVK